MNVSLYLDGTSKPNPGHCAYGFVLYDENNNIIETSGGYLGLGTNNIGEYCGLIFGLISVLKKNIKTVTVYSDSLLMVKQIQGEYKVKEETLKKFNLIAKSIIALFEKFEIHHIPDVKNDAAHKAANSFLPENILE